MSGQWEEFRRQFCHAAGIPDPGSDPEGVAAWARANAEMLETGARAHVAESDAEWMRQVLNGRTT